jgi:hypothetical protein
LNIHIGGKPHNKGVEMAKINISEMKLNTFSAKYNTRYEKVDGDLQDQLCIVCGRTTGDNASMVWIVEGGSSLATTDETNVDSAGDMGWWRIGSECIKSVPKEFRISI